MEGPTHRAARSTRTSPTGRRRPRAGGAAASVGTRSGYAVEVTGLSPRATERDVYDFFSFSGSIESVEIIRSGECACTAYVTFKDSYSQETACLLSGATIIYQPVCITRWGHYQDEFDFWNRPQSRDNEETHSSHTPPSQNGPSAGEVGVCCSRSSHDHVMRKLGVYNFYSSMSILVYQFKSMSTLTPCQPK